MRAYYFGNMYLSSIQQGIQAAHVTAEIYNKYMPNFVKWGTECCFDVTTEVVTLVEWAMNHKTMILLNAGYGEEIHSLLDLFNEEQNPYPWAPFFEGKDALDGALTCVGIVLPEKIYETSKLLRENSAMELFVRNSGITSYTNSERELVSAEMSLWDLNLALRLNRYGLAK